MRKAVRSNQEQPTLAASRFADTALNPNPGTTTVAPVTFNLRYPGQYADSESGLSYNYFRSYSPNTGRYVQPDPIGMDGGWNRFAYVEANPLQFTDPEGSVASNDPWYGYGGDKGFKDWWHTVIVSPQMLTACLTDTAANCSL